MLLRRTIAERTNHVSDGVSFFSGHSSRFVVHPVEIVKVVFEGLLHAGHHRLGQRFRLAVKVLPDEHGAHGEAHHVVRVGDARSPRLLAAVGAHEKFAQGLVGVSESLGQARQVVSHNVPCHVIVQRPSTYVQSNQSADHFEQFNLRLSFFRSEKLVHNG